jgi:hypothetical protein
MIAASLVSVSPIAQAQQVYTCRDMVSAELEVRFKGNSSTRNAIFDGHDSLFGYKISEHH